MDILRYLTFALRAVPFVFLISIVIMSAGGKGGVGKYNVPWESNLH